MTDTRKVFVVDVTFRLASEMLRCPDGVLERVPYEYNAPPLDSSNGSIQKRVAPTEWLFHFFFPQEMQPITRYVGTLVPSREG